jgi:transposase
MRKLARNHRSGDLTAVWVPDEGSEALRDLVRAREAAKQDQLRARHRSEQVSVAYGSASGAWGEGVDAGLLAWVRQLCYAQPAQGATLLDYLHEVEHMGERVKRLEQAISGGGQAGFAQMQEVVAICRLARHRRDLGGDHRGGVGPDITL